MTPRPRLFRGSGVVSAAWGAIERFAFAPARAEPLAVLRIGLATVLLGQAVLIAPSYRMLYGRSGLVLPAPLQDMFTRPGLFRMSGVIRLLASAGIDEASALDAAGVLYGLTLVALLLGFGTRAAAALACVLHLLLQTAGEGTNYGADWLAQVFLFYLAWFPSGAALSLDRRLGRVRSGPSPGMRLALRVVQIHLSILYAANGVGKARYPAWWNGDAIWQVVMSPAYGRLDFSWFASHSWVAALVGWTVVLVEIGYAVLIWPLSTRRIWVPATAAMHLGIAVFMGLPVFGALMTVFTVAAFGVSAEPRAGPPGGSTAGKLQHPRCTLPRLDPESRRLCPP
jgi:hypothetical protein